MKIEFLKSIFLIILFSILVLFSCAKKSRFSGSNNVKYKINNTIEYCKNGDILLRSGTGVISNMIRKTLNENNPFTHCGIICRNKDSLFVIHSVAKEISNQDGIQTTTIGEFLKNSNKNNVALYRLRIPKNEINKMINNLKNFLKQQINFDYHFDLKDSSKMYCSEIIYYALNKKIRDRIFKLKRIKENNFILFSTFYIKENFKEIKI